MKAKNTSKLLLVAIFLGLNAHGSNMQDALDSKWYGPLVNALNELDSEYFKYSSLDNDELAQMLPDEIFVEVSYYEPYVTRPRSQYFGDMNTSEPVIFKSIVDTQSDEVYEMSPIIRDCYTSGHINLIPMVLNDYAKEPRAKKRDLIVYELLKPFAHDEMPSMEIESWQVLADVPNPIYRLIAIEIIAKSFPQSLLNKDQLSVEEQMIVADARLNALSAFFGEEDRYMLYTLVRKLASVPSQESLEFLSAVYSKAKETGDLFFIYEAEQSMNSVKRRLGEFNEYYTKNTPASDSLSSEMIEPSVNESSEQEEELTLTPEVSTGAQSQEVVSEEEPEGTAWWIWGLLAIAVVIVLILLARKSKG